MSWMEGADVPLLLAIIGGLIATISVVLLPLLTFALRHVVSDSRRTTEGIMSRIEKLEQSDQEKSERLLRLETLDEVRKEAREEARAAAQQHRAEGEGQA